MKKTNVSFPTKSEQNQDENQHSAKVRDLEARIKTELFANNIINNNKQKAAAANASKPLFNLKSSSKDNENQLSLKLNRGFRRENSDISLLTKRYSSGISYRHLDDKFHDTANATNANDPAKQRLSVVSKGSTPSADRGQLLLPKNDSFLPFGSPRREKTETHIVIRNSFLRDSMSSARTSTGTIASSKDGTEGRSSKNNFGGGDGSSNGGDQKVKYS